MHESEDTATRPGAPLYVPLSGERPGARLERHGRAVEITDHGVELDNGAMRRWVDYREIDAEGRMHGSLMRAAECGSDSPLWRLLRRGALPDYRVSLDEAAGRVRISAATAAGRQWCDSRFGSREGGLIERSEEAETVAAANAAGLIGTSRDLLGLFLGARTGDRPAAGTERTAEDANA